MNDNINRTWGSKYGANRNIDSDLGGYILIVENIVVIEMLKQDK